MSSVASEKKIIELKNYDGFGFKSDKLRGNDRVQQIKANPQKINAYFCESFQPSRLKTKKKGIYSIHSFRLYIYTPLNIL